MDYFREYFGEVPERVATLADRSSAAFGGYALLHRSALRESALPPVLVELLLCGLNAAELQPEFVRIHADAARRVGASDDEVLGAVLAAIPVSGAAVVGRGGRRPQRRSRALTSRPTTSFTGVGTPCAAPRRTTSRQSASISVRRPSARSTASEARWKPGPAKTASAAARVSSRSSATPSALRHRHDLVDQREEDLRRGRERLPDRRVEQSREGAHRAGEGELAPARRCGVDDRRRGEPRLGERRAEPLDAREELGRARRAAEHRERAARARRLADPDATRRRPPRRRSSSCPARTRAAPNASASTSSVPIPFCTVATRVSSPTRCDAPRAACLGRERLGRDDDELRGRLGAGLRVDAHRLAATARRRGRPARSPSRWSRRTSTHADVVTRPGEVPRDRRADRAGSDDDDPQRSPRPAGAAPAVGRPRGDARLPELRLPHLRGRGLRQRVDELDVARHREVRQPLVAPRPDRLGVRAPHEHGLDLVLAARALGADGDDRDVLDAGVLEQHPLDLRGGDVLAPAADPLGVPVDEPERPVLAEAHGVARVEPEVAERADRLARHPDVLLRHGPRVPRPDEQLTHLARRHRRAALVRDEHLVVARGRRGPRSPPRRPPARRGARPSRAPCCRTT